MLLRNDVAGRAALDQIVLDYYRAQSRFARNFTHSENVEWGTIYSHFLIDRKYVMRCSLGEDRGTFLTGIQFAIGPHYFSPSEFWSYEASARFKIEASTDAIVHNLALLDEFLGYPDALKKAYGYKES